MKNNELNTIANTIESEKKAAEAAAAAAAEKAILDEVKPAGVLQMIQDVKDGIATFATDENDNIVGFGYHPHAKGIAVAKHANGVLTIGSTEEERKQDELDSKIFLRKYGSYYAGWSVMRIAHNLINAGILPDAEKKINGVWYFVCADQKKVISETGSTVVDLSEDPKYDGVSKELLIELLTSKLDAEIRGC